MIPTRRITPRAALTAPVILFIFTFTPASLAQVNVLTRNYNNQRTGADLSETILNASNVNPNQFGKLFMLPVDDQVYAGLLYVSRLAIAGGTHNVVYVATVNNTLYAFDADTLGPPLWQRNFNGSGRPTRNTEVGQACGAYKDFIGNIGIVGTPVIDENTKTMYLVTRTVEGTATVQRLHAIDITTGADKANSTRIIEAGVPGTGAGSEGGRLAFNPVTQNQRPALSLSAGIVYVGWASFCDTEPYHGWMMSYDAASLQQLGVFNDTPNGSEAGIWMAGAGPVFDSSGNLYVSTGNGSFSAHNAGSDFGETLIKLAPNSLSVLDWFTPGNFQDLNDHDTDFGSAGPTMLPAPADNLLITGAKEGKVYLVNTGTLGHALAGDTQIPQVVQGVDTTVRPTASHHLHNANPVWNSPDGLNAYVWGENDFLHAYRFNPARQRFELPAALSGAILPPVGMPGGMMVVSANGSQTGSGVLWVALPRNGNANQATVAGELYAFNAETLGTPLWSSNAPGDDALNFAKGSPPIVANGKVYAASLSNVVGVYGLKSAGHVVQNLAVKHPAASYTGSTPCSPAQGAANAFDGISEASVVSPATKWCSFENNAFIQVDLGANFLVDRFIVEHAGAGGEDLSLNTRDFNIQVSTDGVNFGTVADVLGNIQSITTHDIVPAIARYVRLNVSAASQGGALPARIYELQVYGSPAPSTPNFALTLTPSSQNIIAGNSATYTATVTAVNGFNSAVNLSVSGLPSGATASFEPSSLTSPGRSTLSISTPASAQPGSFPLLINSKSADAGPAGLSHDNFAVLTINADSAGSVPVKTPAAQAAYNLPALSTDGRSYVGGIDSVSYSANQLGPGQTAAGFTFRFGKPNVPDAWSNTTVPLPQGQFDKLGMLAAAFGSTITNGVFTVNYADGTSQSFTQTVRDWDNSNAQPGDIVVHTNHRNRPDGRVFEGGTGYNLYAYVLPLHAEKTVKSITLPAGKVAVLALTVGSGPTGVPVTDASTYNVPIITSDGTRYLGGIEGASFSATLLGGMQTVANIPFALGPANTLDAWANTQIPLPDGRFSKMGILAIATHGRQKEASFAITYSDGSVERVSQNISDWSEPLPQETKIAMPYHNVSNGIKDNRTSNAYAYFLPLNPAKAVKSVSLENPQIVVFAVTLLP